MERGKETVFGQEVDSREEKEKVIKLDAYKRY